jgi:hypothetical protein
MSLSEIYAGDNGVGKKILAQVKVLENANFKVDIVSLSPAGPIGKILSKVYKKYYDKFLPDKFFTADFYYFRFFGANFTFISLLKKIKKNKKTKIIIEIPTYPYDFDIKKFSGLIKFTFLLDKLLRKKIKKYVDRIITTSFEKYIFEVPTLHFSNGIDCSSIPVNNPSLHREDEINLIAVAKFSYHHAYERLIIGLSEYYKRKNKISTPGVFLHLVGAGGELGLYKKLVESFKLEKYIFFYGLLSGDALSNVFNKCDIGISGLGLHRIQLHRIDDLKSREYLARGLPLITSAKMDFLPKEFEYCFSVPEDETPINIEDIVKFYQMLLLKKNIIDMISEIRRFAERNCDISSAMRPIKDYLLS